MIVRGAFFNWGGGGWKSEPNIMPWKMLEMVGAGCSYPVIFSRVSYLLLEKYKYTHMTIGRVFVYQKKVETSFFYRSNEGSILTKTSAFIGCSQKQKKLLQRNNKSIKRKANSLTISLKPKAPISP